MKFVNILIIGGVAGLVMAGSSTAQVSKTDRKQNTRVQVQTPLKISRPITPPKTPADRPAISGQIILNPVNFDSSKPVPQSEFVKANDKVMKVCNYQISMFSYSLKSPNTRPRLSTGLTVILSGQTLKDESYVVSGGNFQSRTPAKPLKAMGLKVVEDVSDEMSMAYNDGEYVEMTILRDNWNYFKEKIDADDGVCFGIKYKLEKNRSGSAELESLKTNMWSGGECRCRTR